MRTSPAVEVSHLPDLLLAALLDFNIAAIDEDARRGYFHTIDDRDAALDVPDEDWAARSQASLRSIQVGGIVVAPPWDVPPTSRLKPAPPNDVDIPTTETHADVGAGFSRLVIVIQPSMGFGTGHHATTRLCLAALQQLDLKGRRVLDVGTGSGVLAIAASLLGAAEVTAIDDDPDAVQSAQENVALNPGATIDIQTTDLRAAHARTAHRAPVDVVIANLTGGLLIQAAAQLIELCTPGGRLVLSGFMVSEEDDVRAAYSTLPIHSRSQEEEWLCVTLQRFLRRA